MANLLDIRRRIRSVRNTRQITKAMQMVSAAKLRRAQDRALAARPYAQMLTNVLKSLVSRADIFDPQTGEVLHPLLVRRPEKTALLIVVSGEKGLAGAFNANILKAAMKFIEAKRDKNIDILAVGRKARDFFKRRYPMAGDSGERKGPIQVTGEYVGLMNRAQFASAREVAEKVVQLYTDSNVDSVYIVYKRSPKKSVSAGLKRPCTRARAFAERTPRRSMRKPLDLVRRRWTTFTSSLRKSSFATCCRVIFRCSCSAPCWSLKPPSTRPA